MALIVLKFFIPRKSNFPPEFILFSAEFSPKFFAPYLRFRAFLQKSNHLISDSAFEGIYSVLTSQSDEFSFENIQSNLLEAFCFALAVTNQIKTVIFQSDSSERLVSLFSFSNSIKDIEVQGPILDSFKNFLKKNFEFFRTTI